MANSTIQHAVQSRVIYYTSAPIYSVLHKYLQVMVSTKLFVHVSVGPKGSNSVMFVTQDPR